MSNIESHVSLQNLIALGSIYSHQKHIEKSFYMYVDINICIQ